MRMTRRTRRLTKTRKTSLTAEEDDEGRGRRGERDERRRPNEEDEGGTTKTKRMKQTRVTRRRLKARRMRKMVKMKVKMEVQVEDDKDYFNNVHKALTTLQATHGNKIISYAADPMDAAPQPRSYHQSNIASTGPSPRERHRNRGDTLKRNLASGTANYRGMVTATAAMIN